MANPIVQVNVSVTTPPAPSTLQSTGAFISQGGTTTAPGTKTLITETADLTAILVPTKTISSLAWSGGTVTATTAAPHGITTAHTAWLTIQGATPSGYNGTYLATATGASTFTYALVSDPGAETQPGTYAPLSRTELTQMAETFFAQGGRRSVYVLELGLDSPAVGVTYLGTWIAANPSVFYSYLVPRPWASEASYLTFLAGFESLTAKTYFFTTMTNGNYTSFTTLMKCVVGLIEAPAVPSTEFSVASLFYDTLAYSPSATTKVAPLAFQFVYGVTPYPTAGNAALLATYKAAGVNVIGTGAEGGLSETIVLWGSTTDLKPFTYWYAVDWAQINLALALANAVINGSNNPSNPLYYNQTGINRLQGVAARTLANGVSYGMILGKVVQTALPQDDFNAALDDGDFAGQAVINAIPFTNYVADHPSDYADMKYGGFSAVMTPLLGFEQIVFNLNATEFVG